MGGLARWSALAFVCVGCGAFGEPPGDGLQPASTESAVGPRPPPQTASAPVAAPPDDPTSPGEPPPPSTPVGDVVVFHDGFERNAGDVIGEWDTQTGNLELVPQPTGGQAVAGKTDPSFRTALLVKKLDDVRGHVKLHAKVRLDVQGTFYGSGDYCDVLAVWVGGHVLASFYVANGGSLSSWLYGPAGSGGNGRSFPDVPLAEENDLDLDVAWNAKTVSLTASVNGDARPSNSLAALAASTDAPPSVAVGPWCFGDVRSYVTAKIDDVEVRATP
jgi:hypothetical protein